jgi:hypothetical protein
MYMYVMYVECWTREDDTKRPTDVHMDDTVHLC